MFQITLSHAKLKKLVVQGINQSDELDSFGVRRTKVESIKLGRLLKSPLLSYRNLPSFLKFSGGGG